MIIYREEFGTAELEKIKEISGAFGLSEEFAKILFSRGINDRAKISRFLTPSKNNFYDPYLLAGMREAVERIKSARDNGERIVVFGDYDADGICASTVLTRALKKFGISEVFTVIPERVQGYGLTHDLVEETLENYQPDLVITVDCGVSCKEEVAFIEDVGVDVIVTDHHELPAELPDCTLINCKRKDQDYPFDGLCGAGVAYKLAYALLGEDANEYLDLVTVATIADSMPLTDENRDIVSEGLKIIKNSPCKALEVLIKNSGLKEITSTSVAFTLAPRINAAGRMGDARSALKMALSDDFSEINDICLKLNAYNAARQSECDLLFRDAERRLALKGVKSKVIVLADEKWNGGLVGIVAAKLVEKYNKPVVLFTANEGVFHGSARSIGAINVFNAVNYCKDLLIDFGGHAQAAGVTISGDKIAEFERKMSEYVENNYDDGVFQPRIYAEKRVSGKITADFVRELELLEPIGTGNRKPLYAIECEKLAALPVKPDSPHLSIKTPFIDLMYFSGAVYLERINSPARKKIAFEPNISNFRGNDYIKGYVRHIEFEINDGKSLKAECFRRSLLAVSEDDEIPQLADNGAIRGLLDREDRKERICFLAYNPETLKEYPALYGRADLFERDAKRSEGDAVVLCPSDKFMTGDYDKIVWLDEPVSGKFMAGFKPIRSGKNSFDEKISADRAVFAEAFRLLKGQLLSGNDSAEVALAVKDSALSVPQLIFCIEVFLQLKIFYFSQGTLRLDANVKCELKNSALYRSIYEKENVAMG